MSIPLSLPMWLAAVAPIVVLMILMLGLGWGATKAAPIGLGISLIIGFVLFKATPLLIATEIGKGLWSSLTVLMVVWPAVLIYEVTDSVGAFAVFRAGMQKFTPNELLQVILIGWVFVSFLMGITGFGVPVAVGAPLLVGLGVNPLWAVFIPLIGHAWGNTFGTLAVAWDALVLQTDLASDPELLLRTAFWAGCFIWIWNFITGIAICWFYGKMEALKKGFPAVVVISVIQAGGQLLLSQVNQTLCCFVPCCVALVAGILLGKTKLYNEPWKIENSPLMNRAKMESAEEEGPKDMSLVQAFFPYFILTAVTLFILLIPPVKAFFAQISIGFAFPETATGLGYVNEASESFSPVTPFAHAFFFLLLSSFVGYMFFKKHGWTKQGGGMTVVKKSLVSTAPSAVAVIAFIVMSRIMGGTGMTVVLARGIADVLGQGYAVLAPVVGMLGSFMTSSNMASNVLFGQFQLTTAQLLSLDIAPILAAQTAGGAIGNTICPGNIILGTTTAGIVGQEGIILKKIMPITLSAAVLVGVILFVNLILL